MHKRLRRQLEEALGQEQEASLLLRKLFHKIEEHRRVDGARDSLQHALAFFSDLLQRQVEARPRRANSTRARSAAWLFDQVPFAALVCNVDRKVTAWNAAAEQLFGLPSSDAVGRELSMLVFPGDDLTAARARTALRQTLASGGTKQHLQPARTRAGGVRTFEWTIVSLRDGKGREAGNAALVQERDPLCDRYARACQAVGDGVWDWDLDGERLWLSESFRAMVGARGESEAPSEWIDRVHPEDRDGVQAAIRMHLEGLSPRFESEHRLRHEDGSWRRVLARGEAARDAGGKAVRFSGSAMELTIRIEDGKDGSARGAPHRFELEAELREALARDQFRVHYLPIVDAKSRRIGGFEALIRWDHPRLGLVAPEHFMPYAEETGLVVPMGRWLLDQASREFRGWRALSRESLTLNVNLSAGELRHAGLLESIDATLGAQGLDPGDLVFELTEDLVQQGEHAERIAELHRRGVRLSMEDFGTGACSLNSLNRQQFDCLKIGSSLFTGGSPRGQEPVLVRTIVSLARGLAMGVVAEGVETAEQFEFLCEAGCSAGQGFYFSPSVDGEGARSLLERSASW